MSCCPQLHTHRSPRVDARGARAAWSHHPGGPLRRGDMLDVSATGIAMVLASSITPRPGDCIRVQVAREPEPRRAEVVRVEAEGGRAVVGCRWVMSPARWGPRGGEPEVRR